MNPEVYKIDWGPKPNTRFFAFVPEKYHILGHHKFTRLATLLALKYQMITHYTKPGSLILEPCSGSGFGAEILKNSGYRVECIENNKFLAQMNRTRGLNVREENILDCQLADNCYDGIVFIDAIEHFEEENQQKLLTSFHKTLKSNGVLVIDTPCAPKTGYVNKEHLREVDWADFETLVSSCGFHIEARFLLIWEGDMVMPFRKDGKSLADIQKLMTSGMSIDQVIVARP